MFKGWAVGNTAERWATFVVQAGVSFAGLALCGGMLAAGQDPAVYLPVATALVAYWLPAPRPPAPAHPAVSSQESVGCVEWHSDSESGCRSKNE